MAAGDPGVLKRNFSATAIQTSLVNSISSAATGDTTTSVAVVSVSGFPAVPFTLILDPDGSKEEVVTCVSLVGTTLQIVRGQDSTAAVAHSAGTSVRHGVSGRDFKEEQTHIAARGYDADSGILSNAGQTHVHGLVSGDGSIVGADQVATLTRKTLTTPVINGATLTGTVSSTASIVVSGAGTITGLSSASMVASSAAPKSYVDAILVLQLASAASSATSASMAATSATSAATSASSALTSQTAAATSATSAAASASASASSASASATSATAAATSATSAATSATSAAASASASASSASAAATSASSALTSQTAAATSATSAAASATAAATSATSAAASATASASSASAAATSATSSAASATAAATSATSASASATAAASSAGTAATSAGQAATSATSAATSATSAAASATAAATSATSAAASATTASNSAATATTQATNAATSAASAATSATAAATSATSADASATSAAASYDSFDDRYLGAKATPPTLDNDGNALLTGALYWNTAVNKMYVWSGTAWGEISSSAEMIAYKYTVAAGATSVSGADDNSLTLTYTVGKEQVYINGVLQVRGSDYTASTGSSITGMAALTASDIVTVLAFTAFSVSNTYTIAQANSTFVQNANDVSAGKNFLINGGMDIWQRGTTMSFGAFDPRYLADRWVFFVGTAGNTISQETTTVPTGARYAYKYTSTASGGTFGIYQAIETANTILLAGKQVTIQVQVTGTTGKTARIAFEYSTGVDTGFTSISTAIGTSSDVTLTSGTFSTITLTATVPSTAKTLKVGIQSTSSFANTEFIIFGNVQLEIGSVASAFSRAGGTIAGELAACQRYYWRATVDAAAKRWGYGTNISTTQAQHIIPFPVVMRTIPTALEQTGTAGDYSIVEPAGATAVCDSVPTFLSATNFNAMVQLTSSGGTLTQYRSSAARAVNANAYLGWSAEL
jgi:hypothetical protein